MYPLLQESLHSCCITYRKSPFTSEISLTTRVPSLLVCYFLQECLCVWCVPYHKSIPSHLLCHLPQESLHFWWVTFHKSAFTSDMSFTARVPSLLMCPLPQESLQIHILCHLPQQSLLIWWVTSLLMCPLPQESLHIWCVTYTKSPFTSGVSLTAIVSSHLSFELVSLPTRVPSHLVCHLLQ